MSSFRSNRSILTCLSWLLLLLPQSLHGHTPTGPVTYHGGPIIDGDINIALLWYGHFGRVAKKHMGNFIKSLNIKYHGNNSVATWWCVVESFQSAAKVAGGTPHGPNPNPTRSPKINVKVKKQVTDVSYKYGKVITIEYISKLVQDGTSGDKSLLPVIFTGRHVTVHGLCYGKCAEHGLLGTRPYIIVGNPETECPNECAYPFLGGPNLRPPSSNVGADALVVAFAQGLADLVTNSQLKTGFFNGRPERPVEIAEYCKGIFGTGGGGPMNPGKLLIEPLTGGSFNAFGNRGNRFLLPAIWNPMTKKCWTVV